MFGVCMCTCIPLSTDGVGVTLSILLVNVLCKKTTVMLLQIDILKNQALQILYLV